MTVHSLGPKRQVSPPPHNTSSPFPFPPHTLTHLSIITIGLTHSSSTTHTHPGHSPNTWGYHSDDGLAWEEGDIVDSNNNYQLPPYGVGDTVGVGVNFETKTAWLTKNGKLLGSPWCMMEGRLWPVVGVGERGTEVSVNFGDGGKEFMWGEFWSGEVK